MHEAQRSSQFALEAFWANMWCPKWAITWWCWTHSWRDGWWNPLEPSWRSGAMAAMWRWNMMGQPERSDITTPARTVCISNLSTGSRAFAAGAGRKVIWSWNHFICGCDLLWRDWLKFFRHFHAFPLSLAVFADYRDALDLPAFVRCVPDSVQRG